MAWSQQKAPVHMIGLLLILLATVIQHGTSYPETTIMIKSGRSNYVDSSGNMWLSDRQYLPGYRGVVKHTNNTIDDGTNDSALYQSCRVFHRRKPGPFQYNIPVTSQPGEYEVSLYFAEIHPKRNGTGERRFDIVVQGQTIRDAFDIYHSAGEALYKPTVLKTTVTLNSSDVVVELRPRKFHPMICGIKVSLVRPTWRLSTKVGTNFHPRHEACFVMASDGKAYMIGGRAKHAPVNVYDPDTNVWSSATPPSTVKRLHHMQCVPDDDGQIWIVSAWTGNCCREQTIANVLVFDTKTLQWIENKTALPEDRRRGGGAAAVRIGRSIYLVGGNRGGHGAHSSALPWFDRYDMDLDRWETHLPDAPHARDHTGGSALLLSGSNYHFCVAGGRDSGVSDFFNATIGPTDCFNFATHLWTSEMVLNVQRAGAAYGTSCDGTKMIIAGGEGFGRAWDIVDVFDGQTYSNWTTLNVARHGTGLAVDCRRNRIYIASGSGNMGGTPELSSFETIDFNL